MSTVAEDVLEEFGRAVNRARSLSGWNLDDLAGKIDPSPGISFLSNVEKGLRAIGPVTVGKLVKALELPETWLDRFLDADIAPEAEETATDRDADRLIHLAGTDQVAPDVGEALLVQLAEEFATGPHETLTNAYNGLKSALTEAQTLKLLGKLTQNSGEQVTVLLRRVSDLNDQGLRDAAAAEVEQAIADLDATQDARKAALTEIGLRQDRVRNNPEAAARRLLAQLRGVAHPGGLFRAVHDVWEEWFDRGKAQVVGFDLNVALHLARANVDRTKGAQHIQALSDLGITQHEIGVQEARNDRLKQGIASFRTVVAAVKAKSEPGFWAGAMGNLAMALATLGGREPGTARLEEAIKTYRAALVMLGRDRVPLDWAAAWGNMAEAMTVLADRTDDLAMAQQALLQLQEAEKVLRGGDQQTDAGYSGDRIPRAKAVIARFS